ncbi:DUF599 domain-containing protein [Devosia rhodophyticola]|uniref:DUF599 domain-containing protein n=1 Tax=Devosia rhodophyticola TaxID=3026423 RepID=A0ABY7YTC1_9HYPH|nr:DUF599 domain-containing protein [Devosia rhodophyticola]WDR04489.1 DUF599 domain-containing protein [Devosia rhodophyticola]
MTLVSTLFPLLCYFVYNVGVPWIEKLRPSLSVIMNMQRRRWVANAARRDNPFDAILSGNIMGSVSFMASTAVLLVLAVFAVFGQMAPLMEALASISTERIYSVNEVQLHLAVMLAMFALAFFSFTLSLRQFNHFCIMLGALNRDTDPAPEEIDSIAKVNALGAQNFNSGIRAYYFSVATVAWFAAEWLAILTSLLTVLLLIHREFFSTAHRAAASAAVQANRRAGHRR